MIIHFSDLRNRPIQIVENQIVEIRNYWVLIPKVYFKSHERYYSSPFHECTGCREGRLAGFALLQAVLLPFGATSKLKTQEKKNQKM